jgi:hypothetical protein
MATIADFSNSQIETSICSDETGKPYWLFQIYRGDATPRAYHLPENFSDWPAEANWENVEDRKTSAVDRSIETDHVLTNSR